MLIDRALPDLDCDLVVSDSAAGARRLVEHLIAVGHRDIAHITDADDTSTGRERLRGYQEALAAAGMPYRDELVFRTTVDQIGGYRATQQVLALDPLPTAIFTVNNMTAVGAMQALRERGMSVPQDMALVCFDDVEHLAVLSPFLTVIDQPAETFGSLGDAATARAHFGQGRHEKPPHRAADGSHRAPVLLFEDRRAASLRPARVIDRDTCLATADRPVTSFVPSSPIPYDCSHDRWLGPKRNPPTTTGNPEMTRIKPSLPAEGIFLGRARTTGTAHPLVVTVRGGEIVDITSSDAPTVRDVCEMDDPAGYVSAAKGKAIGALDAIAANSFEAGRDPVEAAICFRRSTCRRSRRPASPSWSACSSASSRSRRAARPKRPTPSAPTSPG